MSYSRQEECGIVLVMSVILVSSAPAHFIVPYTEGREVGGPDRKAKVKCKSSIQCFYRSKKGCGFQWIVGVSSAELTNVHFSIYSKKCYTCNGSRIFLSMCTLSIQKCF